MIHPLFAEILRPYAPPPAPPAPVQPTPEQIDRAMMADKLTHDARQLARAITLENRYANLTN
jgi:hypothetical protein